MASTFGVDILFRALGSQQIDQAAKKLQGVETTANRLKGADPFQGVENSAKGAGQEIDKLNRKAKESQGAFNGLAGALGRLGLAAAAFQAGKFIFGKTAEIQSQTKSIETLTGSLTKAKAIIAELQQYSNVTPFTSTEVIDTAKRLTAFGVSAEKVVETTKRLGDVAGATGSNLGELSLAYGQVMAKGRLQGEELLQFQERGVALGDELRRMYKLSGEEFSDAMRDGQISAEAVEVAVKRLTDTGGKYANGAIAQSDTLGGKFSTLTDSIETLARKIGQILSPALVKVMTDITNMVNTFVQGLQVMESNYNSFMQSLRGKSAGELQSQISQIDKWIENNQGQLGKVRAGSQTEQMIQAKLKELRTLRASLQKDLDKAAGLVAPTWKPVALPVPTAGGAVPALLGGDGAGGKGSGSAAKAAAEKAVQPLYISLVDLGKRLQAMGYTVKEHPQFGGVGRHSPNSYHYYGEALDVTDQRGGDWRGRTAGLIGSLRGSGAGFSELLGPGNAGHDSHAHIAAAGGKVKLTDKLAQFLGLPSGGERGDQALSVMNQAFDEMARKIEAAREAWTRMKQGMLESNTLLEEQVADQNEINRLVMEGETASKAADIVGRQRELLNIEKERATQLSELKGIEGLTTDEIKTKEQEINEIYAKRLELQGQLNTGKDTAVAVATQQADAERAAGAKQSQAESDARGIAGSITGGMKEAIKAAITGGDVKAALANMLSGIGDRLMDIAFRPLEDMLTKSLTGMLNPQQLATQANTAATVANTAALQSAAAMGGGGGFGGAGGMLGGLGSLFGGGGGMWGATAGLGSSWGGFAGALNMPLLLASGGSVDAGGAQIVGERGPELFVPGQSGGITNHQNLRSMMASGDKKGGAGAGEVSLNMSFETTRFMDRDWVDREQLDAAMTQAARSGAKQGQQRTLDKLRQSPSTRRRLGL